jgi:hypothetical protein
MKDARIGDVVVLAEDGGYASVEILSKEERKDWVEYKIRFVSIFIQYPYVPYNPGDEIEIGYNTSFPPQPGCWWFEGLDKWQHFKAPEVRV